MIAGSFTAFRNSNTLLVASYVCYPFYHSLQLIMALQFLFIFLTSTSNKKEDNHVVKKQTKQIFKKTSIYMYLSCLIKLKWILFMFCRSCYFQKEMRFKCLRVLHKTWSLINIMSINLYSVSLSECMINHPLNLVLCYKSFHFACPLHNRLI